MQPTEHPTHISNILKNLGFSTDPKTPFPSLKEIEEFRVNIQTSGLPIDVQETYLSALMELTVYAQTLPQQPPVLASTPSETTTTLAKRWKDDDDDVPPQPPAASPSSLTVPRQLRQQPPSPPHHHPTPIYSIVKLESTMPGIPAGTVPPQAVLLLEPEYFGTEIIQLNAVLLFPSFLEAMDFSQALFDLGVRSDSGRPKYVDQHRKGDPRFGVVLTQDNCTTLGIDLEAVFSKHSAVQTWQAQKASAPRHNNM